MITSFIKTVWIPGYCSTAPVPSASTTSWVRTSIVTVKLLFPKALLLHNQTQTVFSFTIIEPRFFTFSLNYLNHRHILTDKLTIKLNVPHDC